MSDLDQDLNAGWQMSRDYRPHKHDECHTCQHEFWLHTGENYEGSNEACTYETEDGRCGCIEFDP